MASLAVSVYLAYHIVFQDNVKSQLDYGELKIYPADNFANIGLKLNEILIDTCSFKQSAALFNLLQIKPGRYLIKKGMSNVEIINKLKSGTQDPIKLTINAVRDIYQLAAKLGSVLMYDSAAFVKQLTDSNQLKILGYNEYDVLSLFIPNTYEVYWSVSPDRFIKRMKTEHENFWSQKNRLDKAIKKGLTANQVYTIASIVDKETIIENEKSIIAGVYLNRIQKGMKLQADPTVVFALGQIGLKRVLLEHLKVESPYNTYLFEGLPPGPICMPELSTIDSVLNAGEHEFIFFCARPGYDGGHVFAETLEAHGQNARKYRLWLNQENIK